jgi:hypothetical protein
MAGCSTREVEGRLFFSHRRAAMKRYTLFVREHQIVRFSIDVETEGGLSAAIIEARTLYQTQGAQLASQAEAEIDDAEFFSVDEINPETGRVDQSQDLENISVQIGEPIDLDN